MVSGDRNNHHPSHTNRSPTRVSLSTRTYSLPYVSDRRGSRSPQETTPSRPHSKGAGTDTRADSSPTESSIPSDDSAALESDDHWMDQTSSDDSHGGGSNAKKGSVSKAAAHAAAARDDEQHSWDASDDLL